MNRQGIVYDLPEEEYHASPELSSHDARDLLASPAKYRYAKDHGIREDKAAFDLGTAVHAKVLGTGAQAVAYPLELLAANGAVSTAAAKAWGEEQRSAGLIPVKAAVLDEIDAMTEAVLSNSEARSLLEVAGHAEASLFAADPETGVPVRCRFDFLPDDLEGTITDLKTDRDASPQAFAATAARLGYHIQRSFYLDARRFDLGLPAIPSQFKFVVVESSAPYLTAVYDLSLEFCEMGDVEAQRARQLFASCTATGTWPGYPEETIDIAPPMWAIYQFQDQYGEIGR